MFIKIHDTLVNKNYIHSIHPVDKEGSNYIVTVDYINIVKVTNVRSEAYYNKITPRKYKYTSEKEAIDFYNYLASELVIPTQLPHEV